MRFLLTEYVLKGVYLGLLVFVGLHEPDWTALAIVTLLMAGGLALFLLVGAIRKVREGYRVKGRVLPFVLFLILESPELVYAGVLVGAAVGAILLRQHAARESVLVTMVAGGALLGTLFWGLRHVRNRW